MRVFWNEERKASYHDEGDCRRRNGAEWRTS